MKKKKLKTQKSIFESRIFFFCILGFQSDIFNITSFFCCCCCCYSVGRIFSNFSKHRLTELFNLWYYLSSGEKKETMALRDQGPDVQRVSWRLFFDSKYSYMNKIWIMCFPCNFFSYAFHSFQFIERKKRNQVIINFISFVVMNI